MAERVPDEQPATIRGVQSAAGAGPLSAPARRAQDETPTGAFRRQSEGIGLQLSGRLPCCVCKYDLQGLSVRGVCPECGTAVRATILYAVDPEADAFQPLPAPTLTALGLVLWPAGAIAASLLMWAPRLADFAEKSAMGWTRGLAREPWLAPAIIGCVAVSMLGAATLIAPVRALSAAHRLSAALGVLAYGPLLWALWQIHGRIDPHLAAPYVVAKPDLERTMWRLAAGTCIVVILLSLRPNARRLVARSLTLRTGRVDRQTLLGMAVAAGIAAFGDGLRVLALRAGPGPGSILEDGGTVMILAGSLLLTAGFISALFDGVRIGRAIRTPSPGIRQVLGLGPKPGADGAPQPGSSG